MNLFSNRPKPEAVFTPRSNDINQKTYAERPALEKRLIRALSGHKYIIVHGESGNGKTWLYKRVLQKLGLPYCVINLARMNTEGSLNEVISSKLGEMGSEPSSGSKREFDGGVRPMGVGGGVKSTYEYKSMPMAPIELLAKELNLVAKGKMTVIVLDNFEQIIDSDDFVRQIASLIISADEDFISANNVKFMLVGTPTNIKDLISKVSNANTIANRVVEIQEVERLEFTEARNIMSQGFETHLRLSFSVDKNVLYKEISHKTDRIAQHVQELCLKIAQNALDNNEVISRNVVAESEREWIEETLSADLAVVEGHMNSQRTTVGRKNQVLYCLGLMEAEDFSHHDVEKLVRRTFTVDQDVNLNIPQILSGFSKSEPPLIRKAKQKGSKYRFCSPKIRMVIRSKLELDGAGIVSRRG